MILEAYGWFLRTLIFSWFSTFLVMPRCRRVLRTPLPLPEGVPQVSNRATTQISLFDAHPMKYWCSLSPGFVLSTLHLSHSNSTASTKQEWSEAVVSSDHYSTNVCCLYMVDRPSTVFRRHFLAASSMDLKATQAIANTLQTSGRSCLERFEKFAAQILIRLLHSSAWT